MPMCVVVVLAVTVGLVAGCGSDDATFDVVDADGSDADYSYRIPPGAGEAIDRGEPLDILPGSLDVSVGEVIELVNADDRGHLVGPFFVGATRRFSTASPSRGVRGDLQRPPERRARAHCAPMIRRGLWLVAMIATVCVVLGSRPSVALADPAGPTDYRSVFVDVDALPAGIDLDIVGGDSFVLLTVAPGITVDVVGYRGEPYLRFSSDGVVERNQRSPSRWLNEDRYGATDLPDVADHEAEPDWRVVANDGSFAWHDHRAHWMNAGRPPGAAAGDVVLEATVPLVIDGESTAVTVLSVLLPGPSIWPSVIGAALATASFGVAWRRFGLVGIAVALMVVAALALVVGALAYTSVPAETGPPLREWAAPGVAAMGTIAAIIVARADGSRVVTAAVLTLSGLELAWWAVARRSVVSRALLPTDGPPWLDRAATTSAATVALLTVVVALALATTQLMVRGSD